MSVAVDEVKEEVTDACMKVMENFGFNPTLMRIYFTIFFAPEELGLKEICEDTGYSVSMISSQMSILERLSDIRKFKKPGSKRIYYECQHDVKIVMKKKMTESMNIIANVTRVLKESDEKLARDKDPESERIRGYLNDMRKEYGKAGIFFKLLRKARLLPEDNIG